MKFELVQQSGKKGSIISTLNLSWSEQLKLARKALRHQTRNSFTKLIYKVVFTYETISLSEQKEMFGIFEHIIPIKVLLPIICSYVPDLLVDWYTYHFEKWFCWGIVRQQKIITESEPSLQFRNEWYSHNRQLFNSYLNELQIFESLLI